MDNVAQHLRSNFTIAFVVIVVAVCGLAGCGETISEPTSQVVARYRDGEVSRAEYEGWLKFRKQEHDEELFQSRVENMLLVATLAEAEEEHGIGESITIRIVDSDNQLKLRALRRHTAKSIVVPADEVETIARDNPDAFSKPRRIRLRNVYKRIPGDATIAEVEALRRRMANIHGDLQNGEDFGEIAERESDSQSRFRKGLIGNVEPGNLRPEIAIVAQNLGPGEFSTVIETADGFTILFCEDILEAREPTAEEVRARIASNLQRIRSKALWEKLLMELVEEEQPRFELDLAMDPGSPADAIVARFNSGTFDRGEFEVLAGSRNSGRRSGPLSRERAQSILQSWVIGVSAARRVRDLGLDDNPGLQLQIVWARRQILAGEQLRRRVEADLDAPSDQEVHTIFEENRSEFRAPERYRLAVIRIDSNENDLRAAHRRAQEIVDDVRGDRITFDEAARSHSDHPSAAQAGLLGWLGRPRVAALGPELWKTITGLEPGEVSDVVQVGTDLWIIELQAIEEARLLDYDEAAEIAERRLGNARVRELQRRIEENVRRGLVVELV